MTLAAIDVGTNSVKMLIGRVTGRAVTPLLHRSVITRLGEGLQKTGEISDEAADRTIATLAEYRALAQDRGATRIEAVACEDGIARTVAAILELAVPQREHASWNVPDPARDGTGQFDR